MTRLLIVFFMVAGAVACSFEGQPLEQRVRSVSGIYPHLAHYNDEDECGTGAVVPWADRLWVITYGPHLPLGSSDKLYEINADLERTVHEESIGGTPANRMIHQESSQLFIGPYVIDHQRQVRTIPYTEMPGRHTGNARHLFDPANQIYYGTMEEGFYDVNVHSLAVHQLYKDGNDLTGKREHDPTSVNPENATLPGAHGKGLYSGQGVLVYSNNGEATEEALEKFDIESGVLAEWDGEHWKIIRRNQFVEVTGPGGIYGNENPDTDPIWVTGWDHRSIIVGVRSPDQWQFYRLPKASHSYDGAHGWNTEWPRIRNVGTEDDPGYLMTMHGMFWTFPATFSSANSAGIRPRSAYLKVIGDFCRWNDQLVFGCDDSARREFLNKRKLKGEIGGPGQSNSNLWFTSPGRPDSLGMATASGAVWMEEQVDADETSEPFLFAGWDRKVAWLTQEGSAKTTVIFEVDVAGNNHWEALQRTELQSGETQMIDFSDRRAEWIRARTTDGAKYTLIFNYTQLDAEPSMEVDHIFSGISRIQDDSTIGGLLYSLGDSRQKMGVVPAEIGGGNFNLGGYYELDEHLDLIKVQDPETEKYIKEKFAIPKNVLQIDEASVLVIDEKNRRWRLPKGSDLFTPLTLNGELRICREVATERDLFNCHGTFYELPAENADGMAKVRPVASHNFRIHDYASYRGMLVMSGIDPASQNNEHIIFSADRKAAVWLGVIDDLWKLGKPVGTGGPWKNTAVKANEISDPYLIGFYDKKELTLTHDLNVTVTFTAEVNPVGHGPWVQYKTFEVGPNEEFSFTFPDYFQARWIRFKVDKACAATAWLTYN
ncbi:MAG: hypothetical protein KDC80_15240 [Saprospiraceae bacterium]|nr:hypothetical protein [Saprospiraceae bacterium]